MQTLASTVQDHNPETQRRSLHNLSEKYASEPLRNEDIMFGKKKKSHCIRYYRTWALRGSAATELTRSGAELLVMDREEERVREMRELTENALVVNTLDKKTLTETGIQNCDIAVVCIGGAYGNPLS